VIESQRNNVLNKEEKVENVKKKKERSNNKVGIENFTLNPHNFEQSIINQKFMDEKLEDNYYKSTLDNNNKKNIFFCAINLAFFIYLILASKWYYFNDKLFVCSIIIIIIVAIVDSMLFSEYLLRNDKNFLKLIVICAGFTTYLLGIFTWENITCSLSLIRFVDSHIIFLLIASVFYLEYNFIIQSILGIFNILILIGLDYSINNSLTLMFFPEICYIAILYFQSIYCIECKREEYSRSIFKKKLETETFSKYINSLLNGMASSIISIKINNNNNEEDIIYSNNSYADLLKHIKPELIKSNKIQETDALLLPVNYNDTNENTETFSQLQKFECK